MLCLNHALQTIFCYCLGPLPTFSISKAFGILYQNIILTSFRTNTMLRLYYALIYPYLYYCDIIWCCATPVLHKVIVLQKRAVRLVARESYDYPPLERNLTRAPIDFDIDIIQSSVGRCSLERRLTRAPRRRVKTTMDL